MDERIETVEVNGPGGPCIVNRADFEADQEKDAADRIYSPLTGKEAKAAAPAATTEPAAAPATLPPGFYVMKDKTKFYITNETGAKITDNPLIDPKGYTSEDAANAVIAAIPK